jgi:DNA ligase-1
MRAFEVMKAHVYRPGKIEDWSHYQVEPKMDGVRVICLARDGDYKFYSRNGRELDMFSHLVDQISKLRVRLLNQSDEYRGGVMIDGEMCSTTFNDIGGAIHRKNHTEEAAVYHVFFAMPIKHFIAGEDAVAQRIRHDNLSRAVARLNLRGISIVPSVSVASDRDVKIAYREFLKGEYEGAMLKNMAVPWIAKRHKAWLKLKESDTEDLPIVGWKPGKGKYEGTLGAVYVERKVTIKGKKVLKRVSVSGMSDDVRDTLFNMRHTFSKARPIAEIEFQKPTVHGSLRHPRFIKLRPDKEQV